MPEMLKFDLGFQEKPFTVIHEGKEKKAVLREMSGTERESYLSHLSKQMEVRVDTDNDGSNIKPQVKRVSMAGDTTAVLECCCYWIPENAEDKPIRITKQELLSWPAKVLHELTKIANEMNAFDKDAKERAEKNSTESDSNGSG